MTPATARDLGAARHREMVRLARQQGYCPTRRHQPKVGYLCTGTYPYTLLVPDPNTAPLVRAAYMMVASGASLLQVSQCLGDALLERVPQVGRTYLPKLVAAMVKDQTYEGYVVAGGRVVAARHEPLVTEELASAARLALKGVKRRATRRSAQTREEKIRAALEEGFWARPGRIPYGTRLEGTYPYARLCPGKALKHIEAIVERLCQGEAVGDIEVWVQHHLPPPAQASGWKPRTGKPCVLWHSRQLRHTLRNPGYRGLVPVGNLLVKAQWEPLLDVEKLDRALERLEKEVQKRKGRRPIRPIVKGWAHSGHIAA